MFNLGFGEILVICVVLIIVVGPERLPSLMKNVGKAVRTMRQASRDLQTSVGLDEIMREDIMQPLPRPFAPPPAATISRDAPSAPAQLANPDLETAPLQAEIAPAQPAPDSPEVTAESKPVVATGTDAAPATQSVDAPGAPKAQG